MARLHRFLDMMWSGANGCQFRKTRASLPNIRMEMTMPAGNSAAVRNVDALTRSLDLWLSDMKTMDQLSLMAQ